MSSQTPSNDHNGKKVDKSECVITYIKTHVRETIAYAILALGIILMFVDSLYGGTLVGIIAGIYFGDHVVRYLTNWKICREDKETSHNIISAAVALTFLIAAPGVFLGMAVAIGLKKIFVKE